MRDGSRPPRRGATKVYPHAKNLQAKEVARLLDQGETWASLERKGLVKLEPQSESNSAALTFTYKGTRIRFATVSKFRGPPTVAPASLILAPAGPTQLRRVDGKAKEPKNEAAAPAPTPPQPPSPMPPVMDEVDSDEAIEKLYENMKRKEAVPTRGLPPQRR